MRSLMMSKPPARKIGLKIAIEDRIYELKEDRAKVRHRIEFDGNANELAGLRNLDKILTRSIVELEKKL